MRSLVCAGLIALALPAAGAAPPEQKATTALYQSRRIEFTPDASLFGRKFYVGEMMLGQLLPAQKPKDRRLNLYIVMPGSLYDSTGRRFNLVVSALPKTQAAIDWDVYWVFVLDPTLATDLTSERRLILAAQDAYQAPGEAAFEKLPAADGLRDYLHISSLEGLSRFRRADGRLPRIVIVPAGFGVRAGAVDPENPSPCAEGTLGRTVARLARHCLQPPAKGSATQTEKPPTPDAAEKAGSPRSPDTAK